jgi:hypothetical protein
MLLVVLSLQTDVRDGEGEHAAGAAACYDHSRYIQTVLASVRLNRPSPKHTACTSAALDAGLSDVRSCLGFLYESWALSLPLLKRNRMHWLYLRACYQLFVVRRLLGATAQGALPYDPSHSTLFHRHGP